VKWGQPLWERPPTSPSDRDSIQNATATYLGRLVPLARLVWLGNHDDLILGNGPTYEGYPHWREATATIVRKVRNDTEERVTLAASVSKSTWREIPAVSVIERAGGDPLGGPLALQNLSSEESCEIWVGALIADKAKPIDAIESVYFLPAAMFTDPGRGRYEAGVRSAEAWNARLGKAIAKYRRELKDEIEGDQWKRGAKVKHKAATHYWTAVEQNVSDLLAVVDKPELLHSDGSDSGGDDWHQTAWGRALRYAARSAYDLACPHKTPRQLKAYALGLKALFEERPAVAANADDLPDTEAPNA